MSRITVAAAAVVLSLAAAGAGAAGGVGQFSADPQQSRLEFTGVQAGAEFKGVFHKFTAAVEFAPDALASSRIDVQIDLNSVDTMDKDRDATIRGKDMFDVAHQPTAHYVTKSITKTAAGFSAAGSLTLHGVTKDVPIDFQFQDAAQPKLTGSAKLNRLEFGVGQGDWKSTEWVGDAVKVSFSLVLKPVQ
jgi:polyisoprenoid-binding protein YceI